MDSRRAKLILAARTMSSELITIEVAHRFADACIDHVVLKGPIFAHWLYDKPTARNFGDADLLVRPEHFARAEKLLGELGFEPYWHMDFPNKRPTAERDWVRRSDRAHVDLHMTLWGPTVSPEETWAILAPHIVRTDIGGRAVRAFDEVVNSLHAALHAAQHGERVGKPLRDLELVLTRTSDEQWRKVASLAEALGCADALSSGLRLVAAGEVIALALALPVQLSPETALQRGSPPPMAETLLWLEKQKSWRARSLYVFRALFPSARAIKTSVPLANRGLGGLVLAYPLRWWFLLVHTPAAVRAWRRSRKGARLDG